MKEKDASRASELIDHAAELKRSADFIEKQFAKEIELYVEIKSGSTAQTSAEVSVRDILGMLRGYRETIMLQAQDLGIIFDKHQKS